MTERIDHDLEAFYLSMAQQPLNKGLEAMTMHQIKERAARRVLATVATGTLIVAMAVAAAVVGLAAHVSRITPGPAASDKTTASGPATQLAQSPTPSMPSSSVTLTGAVAGTMQITATVCRPGLPAQSAPPGQPAPGQIPASIEADGLLNGEHYYFIVSQDNPAEPGAVVPDEATSVSLGKAKLGGFGFQGPIGFGVTTFKAGDIAIFDLELTQDQGNDTSVTAVGQIVCP
jgi:hypothetical protein